MSKSSHLNNLLVKNLVHVDFVNDMNKKIYKLNLKGL